MFTNILIYFVVIPLVMLGLLALCRDVLGEEIAPTTIPDDNALAALRAAVNRALVQHV